MDRFKQPNVAVIGLGAQGLATVKNLLEEGFDVTGFDSHAFVGGIWHHTADNRLSALPSTTVNVSKQRACFTDFPFIDYNGSFLDAAAMDQYLNAYAHHFALWPHLHLETTVDAVTYDDNQNRWLISVHRKKHNTKETLYFDKVVIAVGPHSKPLFPVIENGNLFAGSLTHSIAFKDPSKYKGKRVVVIGASNTAADTCAALVGTASKIYFAHRHGAVVLPRLLKDGSSLDHKVTYRHNLINEWLSETLPTTAQMLGDLFVSHISRSEYGALDPLWRITPYPSLLHQVPTVTDTLIHLLRSGQVTSCQVPLRFLGPTTIELQDGEQIEADAIICCTGYTMDFSILGSADPTLGDDGSYDLITPRLYQNIFSLQHSRSLAFIGYALMTQPAALLADLSSMAIAQLWSNKSSAPSLPTDNVMQAWYREHLRWVASIQAMSPHGKFVKLSVRAGPWMAWVEQVTGTNVNEHLSYFSWQGWRFWFNNLSFCNLLMGGIWSPHFYRLFDSDRRKTWQGAKAAIISVNNETGALFQEKRQKI